MGLWVYGFKVEVYGFKVEVYGFMGLCVNRFMGV